MVLNLSSLAMPQQAHAQTNQVVEVRVSAGSDDAEQQSGSTYLTSSDLELTVDGSTNQTVGIRFNNLNIPQGAAILNAYIQFKVDETSSTTTTLMIHGEATDDAVTFTTAPGNISLRPRTNASVSWTPVAWLTVGEAGLAQQTPDIASVIQEIVSQAGWAPGNSLVVIITGDGNGKRVADSYDGDQTGAPLLRVEYSTGGNQAPTVNAQGDQTITWPANTVTLAGTATDDGLPIPPGALTFSWTQTSGPLGVIFADASALSTTATFPAAGTYTLSLSAHDGELTASDAVLVAVSQVINVPGDAAAIQTAIDLANDGDTVLVAPGTYTENLLLSGKTITLASHYHTTGDASYIAQTILDGNGGLATIDVAASVGPGTSIIGFTIQNGDDGIKARGKLNILNNRIINNTDGIDYSSGGGLARANTIEQNGDDGIDLDQATAVVIEDNTIQHNGDDGIEIRLHDYVGPTLEIVIRNNTISGNLEDGIQLIDYPGLSSRVFYIERNLLQGNAMVGLGLMCCGNTDETFEGASIPEPIYLTNNTFVGNNHAVTGGANMIARNNIFVDSTSIAAKNVTGSSSVSHSLFWNNAVDYQASNVDTATTLFEDPLLDASYHLLPGSPAIDAGINAGLSYNGLAPDLGAYEAPGARIVRFAVIGDYGKDGLNEERVANLVKNWNPDFVLTTGDNNYEDGAASTIDQNIGKYYSDLIGSYTGAYGPGSPTNRFWPSLGNHDWHATGATPYLDYFTLPGNERYYAIDRGLVHLYAVDSDSNEPDGTSSTSIQASWLRSALASSTSCFKVVYFHHPPYSSGYHGSSTRMRWPFQSWGADVVLSGHDHTYERLLDVSGFPYFVNGLGGRSIHAFNNIGNLPPDVTSVVRYNADFGAMLVAATPDGITYQFFDASGVLVDTYAKAKNCAGSAPPPPAPSNLTATAVSSTQINLAWTDNASNEDGVRIERCQGAGCTGFVEIATLGANVTTYSNTGLTAGTPYSYRVRAYNANGDSDYSNTASATPTTILTVSLNPTADTYVSSVKPTTNYGAKTTLQVDGSPIEITYVRFDLSGLSGVTIVSATLRMKVTNASTSTQVVKSVANKSWGETTMTYDNRPPTSSVINSFVGGTRGTWREVDITSALAATAGGLLSLAIDSTGGDGFGFSSRESTLDKPVLVISYQ